jgi:ElaB/YqjD/DUF883 family membrane-anchored ribosome-binding protein
MTTVAESVAKAACEYTEPLLAAAHDSARDVRRAVAAGRQAIEDCTDTTIVQVRRHPFMSLGIAAAVGMVAGCVLGFALGRPGRAR